MKYRFLAACACACLMNHAAAQSSATVYGIADVGVVFERGNPTGSVTKLTSGVSTGSRLGFRGFEDLGDGLSAVYLLEAGFSMDTGGGAQGVTFTSPQGILFGRQIYAGLRGGFGALTAGRQYNPYFLSLAMADPFSVGNEGASSNLMSTTGSNGRTNNSLLYATPSAGGFSGELMYSFGEVAGDNSAQSSVIGAVAYANGPLRLRLAHNNKSNDTQTAKGLAKQKNTILAATYDLGAAKIHGAYAVNKGPGSTIIVNQVVGFNAGNGTPFTPSPGIPSIDAKDLLFGITVPVGAGKFLFSYINRDDKTRNNQDASQIAVGYEYALSKRSTLYAGFARMSNKNGAAYTIGNAGDVTGGSGNKGVALGIRHSF